MVRRSRENRRSLKEADRNSYELSALFEVAKNFLEIKDLKALKQQIVISSLGVLGAKAGALLEFDSVRSTLTIAVSLGQRLKSTPKKRFPLRKKWQDFLVRKKQRMPLDVSNATRNSNPTPFSRANLGLIRAIEPKVLVPICEEERLWGLLCLQEKLLDKRYSIEDFNLLTSLATLAGKAWGNLTSVKSSQKSEPTPASEPTLSKLSLPRIKKDLSLLRREYPILKEIVGESKAIFSLFRSMIEVAKTKCPVLILGQTGTGKELAAKAIHQLSSRCNDPFVELNCASIPSELIESELFGYEKGAFTGATGERKGIFEQANNGTLFLDEIGDMSLNLQTKLLRVIQEGRFRRLGGEKNMEVDVRIIAASNKDLARETRKRNFREDLLYRINVYPLSLATLEERREDIPLLADHFLKQTAGEFGLMKKSFSQDALEALKDSHYPGNIRELKNIVERVALRSGNQSVIESFWLMQELKGRTKGHLTLSEESLEDEILEGFPRAYRERRTSLIFEAEPVPEETELDDSASALTLAEIERSHMRRILEKVNHNKTQAARILGIPRSTLIGKMKKLRML